MNTAPTKPAFLDVSPKQIPEALTTLPQWVCWRAARETGTDGKPERWAKKPINLNVGHPIDPTNPSNWSTFSTCLTGYQIEGGTPSGPDGIGFALAEGGGLVGVDLDKCIDGSGTVAPWAMDIIRGLNSYTERSPSGTGLRIFVRAELRPGFKTRQGGIECYAGKRFLTVTGAAMKEIQGHPLPCSVEPRQEALEAFLRQHLAKDTAGPVQGDDLPESYPETFSDEQILEMIRKSEQADRFASLFDEGYLEHDSHSEADLALCNILAFWCGRNPEQMDRIFREGALMRDKWDRDDYRTMTINKAIAGCQEVHHRYHSVPPEEDFTRLAAQVEAGLRPLDIGLALTLVPPKREFVIERYIPKGIIAAMAGTGGQGKSYMALVMAVAVAAGRSIPPFEVSGPGVVLFVSVEDDGQDLAARLHWIGREYQLTAEEQALLEENLIIYPARGHVGPLMQLGHHGNPEPAADSVWLRDRLAQYEPVLTFLDTKSRLFGLEENSNDHGARWVSNLESMLVDHPASSFLVVTHVGKGAVGSSDQHAARGATSFIDNSRSVLVLTAADDKEVKALRAEGAGPVHKLVHAKVSYSAPAPVAFLTKNPMGVPVHLPALEGDRLRDQALTMLVRAMQVSYPAGVNRRNLERGLEDAAMLKELVCDEMGLDRAMWSATIQRGVDKGVLEVFRDESASAKNKPVLLRAVHESGCESESTHHA